MRSDLTKPPNPVRPLAISLFAATLLASPVSSTIYVIPSDEELLAETPLVVYGVVQHTTVLPDQRNTDAFVRVERVLKGSIPGSTVRVRQPGSTSTRLMGLRMLRPGDTVLLFLRPEAPGIYHTVDLGLGAFFEDRNHLDRHIGESGFRHTDRFNDWIAHRVAGVARDADYRVDSIPGPKSVHQSARWIRDEDCGHTPAAPAGWSITTLWDINNPICYLDANGNGWWDDYEPFQDSYDGTNRQNGTWDPAEPLVEWNHNGRWDPAEVWVDNWPWGDGSNPGNGKYDPPEPWEDRNGSCYRDPGEPYTDLNGNGQHDEGDWLNDINCNQTWDDDEEFTDLNGDGKWNAAELFKDRNENGVWDDAEETTDCLDGPYVGTDQLWDRAGNFYYEDLNGNGQYDDGDVKVSGDDIIYRYIRWRNFDPGFTLHCGVDGCTPGDYERNFSIDVDPGQGSWLTPEQKVSAVNSAVDIWKSAGSRAFTGATLSNPLVNARKPAADHTDFFQSFIGVEIGADQSSLGCGAITEKNLLNTSSAVGAAVDYTGAGEQLFVDDYGVGFYDEDGATDHSSTNKYKCTDATWDRGNGTTVGNSTTLLVPGSTTETRASKCTAGTNDDGYYTPGNNPRPVRVPACDNSRVLGAAFVGWTCGWDDTLYVHSIPGGGSRKAYRLDAVRVRLTDNAITRDANGLLSVLAHELGHALGIDHSDADGANIMNATISAGSPVTKLSADDRAAVRKLYPAGSS
ncbi:MAG: matrixin family metalloprotease, partial [Holophagales bacterium]|nr:matrixin family metalloprotease [Holophagales bacterium]